MKKQFITFVTLVFLTGSVFANSFKLSKENANYEKVETNLLYGVESENTGLKASSIFMLGEIQSENAVNRLTEVLRMETDERIRLMAALSLVKIGTERSVYVVKQVPKFEQNKRVAKICDKLYKSYVTQKDSQEKFRSELNVASLF